MNRRDFSKTAGMVAVAAVVAPKILAEDRTPDTGRDDRDESFPTRTKFDCSPEMIEAFELMRSKKPYIRGIFERVAQEYPYNKVPIEIDIPTWQYGNLKIDGKVGIFNEDDYENGRAYTYGSGNLSPIKRIYYLTMWRQAVRNKYTGELKYFVGLPIRAIQVVPGQQVTVGNAIIFDMTKEEIETVARESFSKLQELVVEYHNREA